MKHRIVSNYCIIPGDSLSYARVTSGNNPASPETFIQYFIPSGGGLQLECVQACMCTKTISGVILSYMQRLRNLKYTLFIKVHGV